MSKNEFIKNAEENFLTYAGAVIKSRAISDVEDNLKPVTRRILWAMSENKLFSNKKTVKCGKIVGDVMGKYHPHGDASVYDALIHLAQPWKMRYPLVYVQGNLGNILGDGPAASRYTECRLSNVGDLMVSGLNNRPVDFRPNYDDTLEEPVLLPSIFPNTLCNGSLGIAVGLSASLVPHNINEACDAITMCIDKTDCTTADLLSVMPGPDFPEGGVIVDAEKLNAIYTSGRGAITCRAHYRVGKNGNRNEIVFTDLPYQVEIESGVIKPLKKLVNDEGNTMFYDYQDYTDDKHVEFHVILNVGVSIDAALAVLFSKTKLEQTIKINNTMLVEGEPRQLSLKGMIQEYLRHRHNCIIRIAQSDLADAQHKLTITIGLEKCMSDIDNVIHIIRNADNKNTARSGLMSQYELNAEQADAVLDMKLSRLSRLDVNDLQEQHAKLDNTIALQKSIINDVNVRNDLIKEDLLNMKKQCGDARRTEIISTTAVASNSEPREFFIYSDRISDVIPPTIGAMGCVWSTELSRLTAFSADGVFYPAASPRNAIGLMTNDKDFVITVSRNGYVKKTSRAEFNFGRTIKGVKLKDDDSLLCAGTCNDDDFIILLGKNGHVGKIAVSELTTASKFTLGNQTSMDGIQSACVATKNDILTFIDKENKGKLVTVADLVTTGRTAKGQTINDGVVFMLNVSGRSNLYAVSKNKLITIEIDKKMSIKSKTANGALITAKPIEKIF